MCPSDNIGEIPCQNNSIQNSIILKQIINRVVIVQRILQGWTSPFPIQCLVEKMTGRPCLHLHDSSDVLSLVQKSSRNLPVDAQKFKKFN